MHKSLKLRKHQTYFKNIVDAREQIYTYFSMIGAINNAI